MTAAHRISFMIQRLKRLVQSWAVAIWRKGGTTITNYPTLLKKFSAAYDHPDLGQSSGQRLMWLRQGQDSVADYSICFWILAADSAWNQPTLQQHFCHRLNTGLQKELACRNADMDWDSTITLAMKLDQHLRGKQGRAVFPAGRSARICAVTAATPTGETLLGIVREGDKWKTAFSTMPGHYQYNAMPYRLANAWSFSQAFINDVFRDDILIYSRSYKEQVSHVKQALHRLLSHG